MSRFVYLPLGLVILTMLGGVYTFSLFYEPLQKYYGIEDIAPFTLAFSLITLTYSLSIIPSGILYDRFGPRIPLFLGTFAIFTGYLLAGMMKNYEWETARLIYYVSLGVLMGLGIALADAVPRPLVSKWFSDMPGTAIGIVAVGFGIGTAVMTPLIIHLLEVTDVFMTFVLLGFIYMAVLSVCTVPMRDPPDNVKKNGSLDLTGILGDRRFHLLWLLFFLSSFSGLMVIGNAVPIIQEGAKSSSELKGLAGAFLVVTSLANAGGRFAWGIVLDRIGIAKAMMLNFITTSLSALLLSGLFKTKLVFLLGSVIYANYGGVLAIFPASTSIFFGSKYAGRSYGAIFTAWGISGLIAPFAGAILRDAVGSYLPAFYMASAVSFLAFLVSIKLKNVG